MRFAAAVFTNPSNPGGDELRCKRLPPELNQLPGQRQFGDAPEEMKNSWWLYVPKDVRNAQALAENADEPNNEDDRDYVQQCKIEEGAE